MRNGVNAAASAIKKTALAKSAGQKLVGLKRAVFAVQNGFPAAKPRCKAAVNERAKVVAVDDVRFELADQAGQIENCPQRKPVAFVQHINIPWIGKPRYERASAFQTADVDLKLFRWQSASNVHKTVLHPAWIEGKNNVKNFDRLRKHGI